MFTKVVGSDTTDMGVIYSSAGVTAPLTVGVQSDGTTAYGCTSAANFPTTDIVNDIAGRIVMIRRGGVPEPCSFIWKVLNAQLAGAVGVIVYNGEERGGLPADALTGGMGGGDLLNEPLQIPAVLIPNGFAQPIVDAILAGGTQLTATIRRAGLTSNEGGARPATAGIELRGANPFATQTAFRVFTAQPQTVRVEVYNVRGQLVQSLFDGGVADEATVRLDASGLASGAYIVRATGETFRSQTMVTVVR